MAGARRSSHPHPGKCSLEPQGGLEKVQRVITRSYKVDSVGISFQHELPVLFLNWLKLWTDSFKLPEKNMTYKCWKYYSLAATTWWFLLQLALSFQMRWMRPRCWVGPEPFTEAVLQLGDAQQPGDPSANEICVDCAKGYIFHMTLIIVGGEQGIALRIMILNVLVCRSLAGQQRSACRAHGHEQFPASLSFCSFWKGKISRNFNMTLVQELREKMDAELDAVITIQRNIRFLANFRGSIV